MQNKMTVKKRTPPTSTLSVRVDSEILTAIKRNAQKQSMSVWDYIVSQVDPVSELGRVLQVEQSKILLRDESIRTGLVEFIAGLSEMKQQSGLDNQGFANVIKESFEDLYKQKISQTEK